MNLKSKPLTPERAAAVKSRTKIALAKHDAGESLTETEQRIVYWIRYSAGCHACGAAHTRVAITVRPVDRSDRGRG